MAYLPPHKRHPEQHASRQPHPLPPPTSSRPSTSAAPGRKAVCATDCFARWWPLGSPSGARATIPTSFHLKSFSNELYQRSDGLTPLVLARCSNAAAAAEVQRPWKKIVDMVAPHLLAASGRARTEAEGAPAGEEFKMSFVARVGKVLFHGSSLSVDSISKASVAERDCRKEFREEFCTNVPNAYMEECEDLVIPRIKFDLHSEKERFIVMIRDKLRPDSILACKCAVTEDGGKLEIRKIELETKRHLLVDVSCLYENLDLRLMLVNKRILKDLNDEEKDGIRKLIESAVISPYVKGGLRWPSGKDPAARFIVVGVHHTKHKALKDKVMKVRLGHSDRYDRYKSIANVSTEVTLKLTAISKRLRDGDVEIDQLKMMLEEGVKFTWDHFLNHIHRNTGA